jgi:hypothetical protein
MTDWHSDKYDEQGRLHCEDGPAVTLVCIETENVSKQWYHHGKRHRLDGPAIIGHSKLWYINGHKVTNEIKAWARERNIDLENLTDDDKTVIMVEWSSYNGE